jgi:glutamine amidotransferase
MADPVAIIDSGGANIASLQFALDRLGYGASLTTAPDVIRSAGKVILPGVGAAADAMQRLRDHDLVDVIRDLRQPVLGICLGMQLLADASEEEDVDCLGIIPGTAVISISSTVMPCPCLNLRWQRHATQTNSPRSSGGKISLPHSFTLKDPPPMGPACCGTSWS